MSDFYHFVPMPFVVVDQGHDYQCYPDNEDEGIDVTSQRIDCIRIKSTYLI